MTVFSFALVKEKMLSFMKEQVKMFTYMNSDFAPCQSQSFICLQKLIIPDFHVLLFIHMYLTFLCCCCLVAESSLTLLIWLFWNPVDCIPPGFFVHGISQARILKWLANSLLQEIFQTQGSNPHLLHCRQILNCWTTREAKHSFSNEWFSSGM